MTECKSCIQRAQTIRWLKEELTKITEKYNTEFGIKQKAMKTKKEIETVNTAMVIDPGAALASLQKSLRDRQ